ncbi:hypothetical protein MRB53_025655 [Persea americana]|uniref:Uncharacterized protein n=1 Tax=Persea americana TaxID=3435 RepID=A0ACC2LFX0_PERAE|nr:hypothetical protein MRB53_025655 [Persea americana]
MHAEVLVPDSSSTIIAHKPVIQNTWWAAGSGVRSEGKVGAVQGVVMKVGAVQGVVMKVGVGQAKRNGREHLPVKRVYPLGAMEER